MRTTYDENEDILTLRMNEKPITRETSQDWNICISYAADGSVVEIVILQAREQGAWPLTRFAA